MNKKYLLFDLDGTITASDEGITRSVQYALSKLGINEPDLQKLKVFVGPPLRVAFPKYYGLSREQAEEAVTYYRKRYEDVGIFECTLYDGIKDLLHDCKAHGYTLVLATSKPRIYAHKILERFGIHDCFSVVAGCELDGRLDSKAEVIAHAMSLCGDADKDKYIMIGDRFYDIEGANIMGLESVGVLYGYGNKKELEDEGATHICENVSELHSLLID
ncbi:MAG: HAD hydrolase-like protein [Clostridia bacterium]|nr:HAD hydrolase-like protein [Clostridia bacterium]